MKLPKTTNIFFLLTLFLIPFYWVRFSLCQIPTNIPEFLAILSILFFLIWNLSNKETSLFNQSAIKNLRWPVGLILIGLALSYIFNQPTLSGLGIIKSWFIIPLIFAFCLAKTRSASSTLSTQKILITIFGSLTLVAAIALIYKSLFLVTYDNRLASFYASPNYLAMLLVIGLLAGIFLIAENNSVRIKNYLLPGLILILTALYFTFSLGNWIALTITLFIIFTPKKISRLLWLFFLFICLFFIFPSENVQERIVHMFGSRSSFNSRLMIWQSSLKIIQDYPILGIGPGNFQDTYLQYQKYFPPYLEWAVPQPHNLFLAFYLQTSIFGLIGFIWLSLVWLNQAWKNQKKRFAGFFLAFILYTLIYGLIDTPFWKNDLSFYFWIFLLLSISQTKNYNSKE